MDPETIKKAYEGINKLLTDDKAFNEMIDKIWGVMQKAKGGALDINALEAGINDAIAKLGAKKVVEREKVEKMFAELNSDKAKSATRDDVAKHIRKELEEKKAKIESLKK